MIDARIVEATADAVESLRWKTDSITDISVDVVSIPAKAHQSFATNPAPITSLPLFTVPAYGNKNKLYVSKCYQLRLKRMHTKTSTNKTLLFINDWWMLFRRICCAILRQYLAWVSCYVIRILTTSGTCRRDDSSSWSVMLVCGCKSPPWFVSTQYEPTNTLLATVCRKTSTFSVSAIISSVSWNMTTNYDRINKRWRLAYPI